MSWLGIHPSVSKAAARAVLTPGACKRTVYLVRCLPNMPGAATDNLPQTCKYCGVTYTPAELVKALRRGPHQTTDAFERALESIKALAATIDDGGKNYFGAN